MIDTQEYIKLVYENLKGEISEGDFDVLTHWTLSNRKLGDLRLEIEEAWDLSGDLEVIVDEKETNEFIEDFRNKVFDNTGESTSKGKDSQKSTYNFSLLSGIAALFILSFTFYQYFNNDTIIYDAPNSYLLADNTRVDLRNSSKLQVKEMSSNRIVFLEGEAFFEVAPDESRPFIVNTKHASIEVLGTEFLVKEKGDSTFIYLKEGSIKATNKLSSQERILTPSMKIVYYQESENTLDEPYHNIIGWKSGRFVYSNVTLYSILKELELVFDCNISLTEEKMGNCQLNIVLNTTSIDEILASIANNLNMEITRDNKTWSLIGGACE